MAGPVVVQVLNPGFEILQPVVDSHLEVQNPIQIERGMFEARS